MSLPDLPKFLELLPFLHHHTQFAKIASYLRHQKNSDLEGYYPSIRVVEYLIPKFRNSKTFNQRGGTLVLKFRKLLAFNQGGELPDPKV